MTKENKELDQGSDETRRKLNLSQEDLEKIHNEVELALRLNGVHPSASGKLGDGENVEKPPRMLNSKDYESMAKDWEGRAKLTIDDKEKETYESLARDYRRAAAERKKEEDLENK